MSVAPVPVKIPKPASITTTSILVVVAVALLAAIGVLAVLLFVPGDSTAIVGMIFVALPPTVAAVLSYFKAQQAVTAVDGGFSQFATILQERAHAAGVQEADDRRAAAVVDEARIAGLVAEQVAAFLVAQGQVAAVAPPTAVANVNVSGAPEAVAVEEIKPAAAQAIADAVRLDIGADVTSAVEDALPPKADS